MSDIESIAMLPGKPSVFGHLRCPKISVSPPTVATVDLETAMAKLLVCTGRHVILPGEQAPKAATITIDLLTGRIVDVRQEHQFRDGHLGDDDISWIDAGNSIILPGLVECVATHWSLGSQIDRCPPSALMSISTNPVGLTGKASGPAREPQHQAV